VVDHEQHEKNADLNCSGVERATVGSHPSWKLGTSTLGFRYFFGVQGLWFVSVMS
jgi:hypothetical protein